jgi:hypothetical protein
VLQRTHLELALEFLLSETFLDNLHLFTIPIPILALCPESPRIVLHQGCTMSQAVQILISFLRQQIFFYATLRKRFFSGIKIAGAMNILGMSGLGIHMWISYTLKLT